MELDLNLVGNFEMGSYVQEYAGKIKNAEKKREFFRILSVTDAHANQLIKEGWLRGGGGFSSWQVNGKINNTRREITTFRTAHTKAGSLSKSDLMHNEYVKKAIAIGVDEHTFTGKIDFPTKLKSFDNKINKITTLKNNKEKIMIRSREYDAIKNYSIKQIVISKMLK